VRKRGGGKRRANTLHSKGGGPQYDMIRTNVAVAQHLQGGGDAVNAALHANEAIHLARDEGLVDVTCSARLGWGC
jgi:hypothetical protein